MERIINILEIRKYIPTNIISFVIYEEQLSQEVVDKAEDLFKWLIQDLDATLSEEEIEDCIESGGYENKQGDSVWLIWSE